MGCRVDFMISLCFQWLSTAAAGSVFQWVRHAQTSNTTVEVSWVLATDQMLTWDYRISYTYRLAQIGDCQPVLRSKQLVRQIVPGQSSLTLSGLHSWTSYQYHLKAPVTYFKQEDIVSGVFHTRPARVPGSTVRNVQIHNVTDYSVDISWLEPPCALRNGPLRRFDVQLVGPGSHMILNAYTALYVTVNNLQPATSYSIRVRYVNSVGASRFTDALNFTTAVSSHSQILRSRKLQTTQAKEEEAPVQTGNMERHHNRKEESNWDLEHEYPVYVDEDENAASSNGAADAEGEIILEAGTTSTVPTTALPQTTEDTNMGQRLSRSICGLVDPCAPYNLVQTGKELQCVDLAWEVTDITSNITAFDVYLITPQTDINKLGTAHTSPPAAQKTVQLCGLNPGQFYTVGVRSRTLKGLVSSLATLRVHTDHLVPPKPSAPSLVSRSLTTVEIEINAVDSPTGPVTSYYIVLESAELSEEEKVEAGIASPPRAYVNGILVSNAALGNTALNSMAFKEGEKEDLPKSDEQGLGTRDNPRSLTAKTGAETSNSNLNSNLKQQPGYAPSSTEKRVKNSATQSKAMGNTGIQNPQRTANEQQDSLPDEGNEQEEEEETLNANLRPSAETKVKKKNFSTRKVAQNRKTKKTHASNVNRRVSGLSSSKLNPRNDNPGSEEEDDLPFLVVRKVVKPPPFQVPKQQQDVEAKGPTRADADLPPISKVNEGGQRNRHIKGQISVKSSDTLGGSPVSVSISPADKMAVSEENEKPKSVKKTRIPKITFKTGTSFEGKEESKIPNRKTDTISQSNAASSQMLPKGKLSLSVRNVRLNLQNPLPRTTDDQMTEKNVAAAATNWSNDDSDSSSILSQISVSPVSAPAQGNLDPLFQPPLQTSANTPSPSSKDDDPETPASILAVTFPPEQGSEGPVSALHRAGSPEENDLSRLKQLALENKPTTAEVKVKQTPRAKSDFQRRQSLAAMAEETGERKKRAEVEGLGGSRPGGRNYMENETARYPLETVSEKLLLNISGSAHQNNTKTVLKEQYEFAKNDPEIIPTRLQTTTRENFAELWANMASVQRLGKGSDIPNGHTDLAVLKSNARFSQGRVTAIHMPTAAGKIASQASTVVETFTDKALLTKATSSPRTSAGRMSAATANWAAASRWATTTIKEFFITAPDKTLLNSTTENQKTSTDETFGSESFSDPCGQRTPVPVQNGLDAVTTSIKEAAEAEKSDRSAAAATKSKIIQASLQRSYPSSAHLMRDRAKLRKRNFKVTKTKVRKFKDSSLSSRAEGKDGNDEGGGRKGKKRVKREDRLPPGQIVAELTPSELSSGSTRFVVGTGESYNGFINSRLKHDGRYKIYLVANSEVERILFSVSEPLLVRFERKTEEKIKKEIGKTVEFERKTELDPTNDDKMRYSRRDNFIVMGVMTAVAFLLLFIVIWLKCVQYDLAGQPWSCVCCGCLVPNHFFTPANAVWEGPPEVRGRARSRPFQTQQMSEEPSYATEESNWSETYSLSEPRVIVTGRELLPPSSMVSRLPSPNRAVGSEPITFRREFQSLPRPNPASASRAGMRHADLNNASNIIPFDATRVVLDHDGTGGGDYINASYITGYMDDNGRRSSYIAAQCPFDDQTALDMWRLIYQNSVPTVVVLSKVMEDGSLRCFQFWPDIGKTEIGPFTLQMVDQFTYAHFTERLVTVKNNQRKNEDLLVRIFCFSSWPDKGIPQDAIPFVELSTRVHKSHGGSTSPLLAQCETGSGRTAVFIALDILLSQYATEGQASVYDVTCAMRSERPFMVQTFPQYAFIYEAVLEEMHAGDTWVSQDLRDRYMELNRHNPHTGRTYLRDQFILLGSMLNKGKYTEYGSRRSTASRLPDNAPDLIPAKRLTFTALQNQNYSSNIEYYDKAGELDLDVEEEGSVGLENIVFVDGYRRKNQFIMAETPRAYAVSDFWQIVYENNVRSIVCMDDFLPDMAGAGEYWPLSGSRVWEPFLVELLDSSGAERGISVRTFRLLHTHRTRDEPRTLRQFQFHEWSSHYDPVQGRPHRRSNLSRPSSYSNLTMESYGYGQNVRRRNRYCPPPSSKTTLLSLYNMVKEWQDHVSVDSTPILVHSHQGGNCAGLYVALSLIANRFEEENLVSVYRICRMIRKRCPSAISNFDQYKFLYKALWDCINLPPDGSSGEHFLPPLESPLLEPRARRCDRERRPADGRDVYSRSTESRDVYSRPTEGRDVYIRPTEGRDVYIRPAGDSACQTETTESDYYPFQTVELTETEEEQTEDSVTRVTDHYYFSSGRKPVRKPAGLSKSSNNNETYRFATHSLYPTLVDRPPRQDRVGGGVGAKRSPLRTPPGSSPACQRDRYGSSSEKGHAVRGTPPFRTASRSAPKSSPVYLSRTPSPVPRRRPHSLSPAPVSQGQSQSPRRRRQKSASGRVGCPERLAPASTPVPIMEKGDRGDSPSRVLPESVLQETTQMMDSGGVFYRKQVTDTLQEVSTATCSESDY